jgi:cell division transport system permease protein
MISIFTKDKRLGSSGKRRYDLPLDKNVGTGFLVLLIALMSFLAIMALAGTFALSSMTRHWSSGLENKITIEIPAEKSDGSLRSQDQVSGLTKRAAEALADDPNIVHLDILEKSDIQELISPWLGTDMVLDDIPLPGLISVDLHLSSSDMLQGMEKTLALIDETIRVDTHEAWLADLLRITGALQMAATLIALLIAATAVTAVAGAIRARMAIHKEDVALLHLMGASDEYITRQFQRHAVIVALRGGFFGTLSACIVLLIIGFGSGDTAATLLPSLQLSGAHIVFLLATPIMACAIAFIAARFTVLRVLSVMP